MRQASSHHESCGKPRHIMTTLLPPQHPMLCRAAQSLAAVAGGGEAAHDRGPARPGDWRDRIRHQPGEDGAGHGCREAGQPLSGTPTRAPATASVGCLSALFMLSKEQDESWPQHLVTPGHSDRGHTWPHPVTPGHTRSHLITPGHTRSLRQGSHPVTPGRTRSHPGLAPAHTSLQHLPSYLPTNLPAYLPT